MPDNPDDMPILGTKPTPTVPRTLVSRAELEQALKFVLEQNPRLCPGKWPTGRDGAAMARELAAHIELAGWEVTRGPPAVMMSTPAGWTPNKR